jgi:hypothetical protein
MIAIDGENYYIDVDALDKELNTDEALSAGYVENETKHESFDGEGASLGSSIETNKTHKPREVDGFKYEMYMTLISTVLHSHLEPEDRMMPLDLNGAPLNFTIAFNTLLFKKIIKKL